jgi:hypothetical protein
LIEVLGVLGQFTQHEGEECQSIYVEDDDETDISETEDGKASLRF